VLTPAPTLTSPDEAEGVADGLPLGELPALADDRAAEVAEVAEDPVVGLAGGWAVLLPFDRETSA
jgi:hypothetical protein